MSAISAIGIDLDPVSPLAVSSNTEQSEFSAPRRLTEFPPAFLRAVARDAPCALDYRHPADTDGSGIDASRSPWERRIPLAFVLEQLLAAPDRPLRFPNPAQGIRRAVSEEIGRAAIALALNDASSSPPGPIALIVPNAIQEAAQDALLRGMRRAVEERQRRDQPVLVWRPIAAALEWVERCGRELTIPNRDRMSVGTLVHLHLGLDSFEVTSLELLTFVRPDRTWIVPGRRQPEPGDLLINAPLSQLEEVVHNVFAPLVGDSDERARRAWHACWLTPLLGQIAVVENAAPAGESQPSWLPANLAGTLGRDILARLRTHTPPTSPNWRSAPSRSTKAATDLEAWRRSLQRFRLGEVLGLAVTGALAGLRTDEGSAFGLTFASWFRVPRERVLLGSAGKEGVLATGACRFARRRLRGEPTYLDTLPKVETIVNLRGEPAWRNLLEQESRWVPGGTTWRGEPRDMRFQIDRGQRELELVVHREGASTCRKVGIRFEAPTTKPYPVRLHVEIEPGQGNPSVEVVPQSQEERLFRGRRLHLDWRYAIDTGRSREAELETVPRAFPPLEPRVANRWLWNEKSLSPLGIFDRGLRAVIRDYLEAPNRWLRSIYPRKLDDLRRWFWIRSKPRRNETGAAISSDGLPDSIVDDRELIDLFVLALVNRIRTADLGEQKPLLRILASTSTCHEAALSLLRERVGQTGHLPHRRDRWSLLYACASCFRNSDDLELLYRHFERTRDPDYVDADSLALPLLYRESALERVDSPRVERWLRKLIDVLGHEPIGRRVKLPVSRAALAIGYTLRRRAFDNGFLAPGSPLHSDVRRAVIRVRRPSDPTDKPAVETALEHLDRIVNFIDRKGAGRITGIIDEEAGGDGGDDSGES